MTVSGLDTSRPFTRAAALHAGLGERELRRHRQLLHGVYVDASVPVTPLVRAAAALLRYGGQAFASHATAARIYGLPVPPLPDEHVTVTDRRARHRRAGVVCHFARAASGRTVEGVRVSAPAQVFVELATLLTLVDLVVVGDHLVRTRLVSLTGLREACATTSLPGAARARAAVDFVRPRVDSPMETRLRMLIVLAGLPEPEVNLLVGDDEGLALRRYDLCWPAARLIVEYDGRHHIEREQQWESDLERREGIDDDGWRLVVVTAKGIYRRPDLTLAKVHRLLRERRQPGVPRRLSDRWQAHFPVRAGEMDTPVAS